MSLSELSCRSAKSQEKAYKLGDSGGLYLQITPTGSKLWKLKYRYGGKEKKLSIGQYPETTLAEAREKRDQARKLLSANQDPSLVKQEEKRIAVASAANTFEGLAREWHERNKAKWSANHAGTVLRRLEMDIFPAIGNLK